MAISQIVKDTKLILVVDGDFDGLATKSIQPMLDEFVKQPKDCVIDLSNCVFMDSSGIGTIVYLFKRLYPQGYNVSITGASGQPLELLHMVRVDKVISVGTEYNSDIIA